MILVDSSVWIAYFKGDDRALPLNELIDSNDLCLNHLILAELIPSIVQKREIALKDLLLAINTIDMKVNWQELIDMQIVNLSNGINNVGIADLMIAQNAMHNGLELFTLDKHFLLLSQYHKLKIYKHSIA
jgi:predicted nucleic acid-binding protein